MEVNLDKNISTTSRGFYCNICDCSICTIKDVEAHLIGRRHRSSVWGKYIRDQKVNKSNYNNINNCYGQFPLRNEKEESTRKLSKLEQVIKGKEPSIVIGLNFVTEFYNEQPDKNELCYRCSICCKLCREGDILEHLMTTIHRLNVLKEYDYNAYDNLMRLNLPNNILHYHAQEWAKLINHRCGHGIPMVTVMPEPFKKNLFQNPYVLNNKVTNVIDKETCIQIKGYDSLAFKVNGTPIVSNYESSNSFNTNQINKLNYNDNCCFNSKTRETSTASEFKFLCKENKRQDCVISNIDMILPNTKEEEEILFLKTSTQKTNDVKIFENKESEKCFSSSTHNNSKNCQVLNKIGNYQSSSINGEDNEVVFLLECKPSKHFIVDLTNDSDSEETFKNDAKKQTKDVTQTRLNSNTSKFIKSYQTILKTEEHILSKVIPETKYKKVINHEKDDEITFIENIIKIPKNKSEVSSPKISEDAKICNNLRAFATSPFPLTMFTGLSPCKGWQNIMNFKPKTDFDLETLLIIINSLEIQYLDFEWKDIPNKLRKLLIASHISNQNQEWEETVRSFAVSTRPEEETGSSLSKDCVNQNLTSIPFQPIVPRFPQTTQPLVNPPKNDVAFSMEEKDKNSESSDTILLTQMLYYHPSLHLQKHLFDE